MAGPLGKGNRTHIGRLRQRVTVQIPSGGGDEFGGRATGWTDVETVRAEVELIGGREMFKNGGVQAQATHRVRMRYRPGLTAKHRLVWLDTGLVLNVVACPPEVGTSNLIEVWCVRGE